MKKALWITMAILLLVSMIVLVSCGDTDKETSATSADTTAADTSAADTTAADTTPVGTTEKTPDNNLPDNTDYNEAKGIRFEFMVSVNSYFGTEYNAQGNPLVRRVHDFETLYIGVDQAIFAYEYNAAGALTGYSVMFGSFKELTPLTVTYDEKGRAVSAVSSTGRDRVATSWEYDNNGVIVCETLVINDRQMTFTYDGKGRCVKEVVDYGDGYVVETVTTYSASGVKQKATLADETLIDAEYSFNDKGYPVKVKGFLLYEDMEIVYTYNEKMLCTVSVSTTEFGEAKVELSYNDKDLPVIVTMTNCDENGKLEYKRVFEYTYDENGKIATESESYYNENGQLEDKYISHYEYDAKGNLIKEEDLNYQDGELTSHFVTTWVYDDNGLLTETTSVSYNDRGEAEEKTSVFFEYDAKGNCLKETCNSYNAEGVLYESMISEYVYDGEGACVNSEHKTYDEQNCLIYHETYEYNADGYPTKMVSYHYDFDEENNLVNNGRTEEIYTYDENGSIVKKQRTDYDADGNVTSSEEFTYNDEI